MCRHLSKKMLRVWYSSEADLSKAMLKMQVYAEGAVVEDTGCLICRGMSEEEIKELYNHIDLEGFHCDTFECKTNFHAIVPSGHNCCAKLYDLDNHPLGDPLENGDSLPQSQSSQYGA